MANPYAEFITRVENTYGTYNPVHKAELVVYLPAKVSESELDKLYWKLREEYSAVYKTPPDITQINNVLKQDNNLEGEAQEWFNKLNATGNSLDNVIVSNVRAHKALESMGGWAEFCRRNPEYDHLNRKRFVEAYVKATPEGTPRLMYGESAQKYNKQPLMFGDPAACRDALEYHKNPADEAVNKALNFIENRRI